MSKVPFTEEQMERLRKNPGTYYVTENTLFFTKEFKQEFCDEYQTGKSARDILEDHGYPAEVLGEKRITGISHSIRMQAKKGGLREGPSPQMKYLNKMGEDQTELIKQLVAKVTYLEQEIEYIKKISELGDSKN